MRDRAVVFVPGIMGSELTHQGTLIWPGTFPEWFGSYQRMSELLSTKTIEGKIVRQCGPKPIYGRILDHLNTLLPNRILECPFLSAFAPA